MSDTTTNPYDHLNNSTTYVDQNLISSINRSSTVGKGANLDKDAFLKLLVAQMRYQDPLEPMDNSQMVAQMAQFTSLEQMMAINSTMNSYFNYQMANSVIQYSTLIGQEVSYEMLVENQDGSTTVEKDTSKVTGVKFENGSVILTLENGKDVDVGYVASIGKVSASEETEDKEDGTTEAKTNSGTSSGSNESTGGIGTKI